MTKARQNGKTGHRAWRPSLMGGAIMRSLRPSNTRKRKTFRVFEPGATPRANVIREFIAFQEDVARCARKADGLDLAAVRLSSPVSPIIRLNLGDALGILVVHSQRHLLQVQGIMDMPGFPARR